MEITFPLTESASYGDWLDQKFSCWNDPIRYCIYMFFYLHNKTYNMSMKLGFTIRNSNKVNIFYDTYGYTKFMTLRIWFSMKWYFTN